jgi:Spy/CpxP family protein refolding chaperone
MKKRLNIKTLLAASLLMAATASYAGCYDRVNSCKDKKENYKHYGYKPKDMKYRSHHKGDSTRFIIGAVFALDLSAEQRGEIDGLIKKFQDQRDKRFNAFTKEGFDKEAFIKARMQTKEDRIKIKADLIEDIYSILTKEQKVQLKDEIKNFEKVRKSRYDRSCNGRR